MTTQIANIHLFYPTLFLMIGVVLIIFICSAKTVLIKFKDKESEDYKFKTHVGEHIDTTTKMANMHDNILKVDFTTAHEKEFHYLEVLVLDLKEKVDLLIEQVSNSHNNK